MNINTFIKNTCMFYMHEYFSCVYIYGPCPCLMPQRTVEGIGTPDNRVLGICQLLCGC